MLNSNLKLSHLGEVVGCVTSLSPLKTKSNTSQTHFDMDTFTETGGVKRVVF